VTIANKNTPFSGGELRTVSQILTKREIVPSARAKAKSPISLEIGLF
jgi:hypothetical protein